MAELERLYFKGIYLASKFKESKLQTKTRFVITGIGTIILGAIGSGVWELYLKKVLLFIGQATFQLFASVKSGFANDIYIEAARKDLNNIVIVNNSNSGMAIILLFLLAGLSYLIIVIQSRNHDEIMASSNSDYKRKHHYYKSLIFSRLPDVKFFRQVPLFVFVEFILILSFSSLFINTYRMIKANYVEKAICQYNYLRTTVLPFVDDGYLKQIDSKYFQITNKSDYDSIVNELKKIAKENNIKEKVFKTL